MRRTSTSKSRRSSKVTPLTSYDVTIYFRCATNLPPCDINKLNSDPYVHAKLHTLSSNEDKYECPPLKFRSITKHDTLEPIWEAKWHISNVPQSGSRLQIKVMDEDPGLHDDLLGDVKIPLNDLDNWNNGEVTYGLNERTSKRACLLKFIAGGGDSEKQKGQITVGIEVRGETNLLGGDDVGRPFTIGPHYCSKHFSPLTGILIGVREPNCQRFMFEANKIQLTGPPPMSLKHEYIHAPFLNSFFTKKGIQGRLLNRILHKQYHTIYSYDRKTKYHCVDPPSQSTTGEAQIKITPPPRNGASSIPEPRGSRELAKQFLDMVHYDEGARMFTYVLTLDAEWRFTETGKEFAINMLSKHAMHSNVSRFIAYSGEFFVRRSQNHNRDGPGVHRNHDQKRDLSISSNGRSSLVGMLSELSASVTGGSTSTNGHASGDQNALKRNSNPGVYDFFHGNVIAPGEPELYELVIDNDSGTYRPKKEKLEDLKRFLEANLVGLKVVVYDCLNKELKKLKKEQQERKVAQNGLRKYKQPSIQEGDKHEAEKQEGDKQGGKQEAEKHEGENREVKETDGDGITAI